MSADESEGGRVSVVLDYLPHGRPDDDRPQYEKPPLAHALGIEDFGLYELELAADGAASIGDRVSVEPPGDAIASVRRIDHDELSSGAQSELEPVVEELVAEQEERFVEFYNEAGPITLRLHQLNLLPGIGDKLRDAITDAREREPFEGFEEIDERVSGLHDAEGTIVERILQEVRDEDVKYRLFARGPDEQ